MPTRKKATEELEELEELEEIVDEADAEDEAPESDTLSAKEVANKLGVDARTFRKFLRSKFGKVGQGNRWLLNADDFDELKTEFEAYHKPKVTKVEAPPADDGEADELEELDDIEDEFEDLDELEDA